MDCPGNNTIAELVCRALDEPAAAQVEAHVADCATCRRMMAALAGSSVGRISTAPTVPASGEAAADPVPLRTGAAIGRYRVLELLGAGGMGIVYAAHDPQLERAVALKLLLPELADDPVAARALLLAEAQAMARVRHPNLVAVHDVGTDGERVYIAMELIAGQTLRGWLSKPRSPAEVLRVMIAAGRGLAAAHDAGLVHRDFKPENVLCGAGGQVCVSDFGLALPAGAESSHVAGTPAYMAPEQRTGAVPDPRADQFSFCVVLQESMPRPPRWLARACARGRAADPAARFPSMNALLDELVRDRGRARRRIAVAVGAAAVVLAGGGIALGAGADRPPPPCRGGAAELAAVWSPARRADVERAILATGVPFAADTWARVERALDEHGRRWVAMHLEACEATAVHHSQSPELLDRRMACLADRRADLGAAVTTLAETDRDSVRSALRVVSELPPLAACADPTGLSALAPASPDPRAAAVRDDASRAAALERAGKLAAAIELATRASTAARELGDATLEGEALHTLAIAQHATGDLAAARDSHERVVRAAARSGNATVEARSLAALALLTASSSDGRVSEEYAGHALAIVERTKSDPLLEATVRQAYARVLFGRDHEAGLAQVEAGEQRLEAAARTLPPEALQDARIAYLQMRADLEIAPDLALEREREVLAMAETAYGPDHPKVAAVLSQMVDHAMNASQLDLARELAARIARILAPYPGQDITVRDIESRLELDPARRRPLLEALVRDTEADVGAFSPRVAMILERLSETLDQLGEFRAALTVVDRAVAIYEATYRGRYEALATALISKSELHITLGEIDAAVEAGERAIAIVERGHVRGIMVTLAELMMAELYFQRGRFAESQALLAKHADEMRLLMGGDPSMMAFDFMQAACAWELDQDRPANLRTVRRLYRAYRAVADSDPGTLGRMEHWLEGKR